MSNISSKTTFINLQVNELLKYLIAKVTRLLLYFKVLILDKVLLLLTKHQSRL